MPQYDSPWKEALDRYFQPFLDLCFGALHAAIDWSVPVKMLDKELQRIAPQNQRGPRTVDKLVEVRLRSGETQWLLIHLEVQSQPVGEFAKRMFVYYYRIADKHDRPLVSLAVLGDADPNWRPDRYHQQWFGCQLDFTFPTVKLLDYLAQIESLEQSENPFATVILAHLMTQQTAGNPQDRCQWKLRLLRPMYARGMSAEDVRSLFRVLDWMMDLPEDLALQFEHELMKIEQENHMPYVTSIERRAIARGIERGIEQGLLVGQIQLLQRMLGQAETGREELAGVPLDKLTQQRDDLQSQLSQPRDGGG